jgi:hypothetical protein
VTGSERGAAQKRIFWGYFIMVKVKTLMASSRKEAAKIE